MRAHIVEAKGVDSSVGGLRVEVASVHVEDLPEGLQLRRRDVGPVGSGVGGGPDETIVGSSPDAVNVEGRQAESVDDAAADRLSALFFVIEVEDRGESEGLARKVGRDLFPVLTAVASEPEEVSGEVEIVRVEGRELQRRGAQRTVGSALSERRNVLDLAGAAVVASNFTAVDDVGI